MTFHCLSSAFHCLSIDLSLPFLDLSRPAFDGPKSTGCLSAVFPLPSFSKAFLCGPPRGTTFLLCFHCRSCLEDSAVALRSSSGSSQTRGRSGTAPFTVLSLPFHCLSLPFIALHYLSTVFPPSFTALPLHFHCLSTVVSLPFHCRCIAFPLPFQDIDQARAAVTELTDFFTQLESVASRGGPTLP